MSIISASDVRSKKKKKMLVDKFKKYIYKNVVKASQSINNSWSIRKYFIHQNINLTMRQVCICTF